MGCERNAERGILLQADCGGVCSNAESSADEIVLRTILEQSEEVDGSRPSIIDTQKCLRALVFSPGWPVLLCCGSTACLTGPCQQPCLIVLAGNLIFLGSVYVKRLTWQLHVICCGSRVTVRNVARSWSLLHHLRIRR